MALIAIPVGEGKNTNFQVFNPTKEDDLDILPMSAIRRLNNALAGKQEHFVSKHEAKAALWAKLSLAIDGQLELPGKLHRREGRRRKGAKSGGRISVFAGKKLFPLVDGNDRRTDSHGQRSMNIILNHQGLTYEEFLASGGRRQDLAHDIDRKRVEIREA